MNKFIYKFLLALAPKYLYMHPEAETEASRIVTEVEAVRIAVEEETAFITAETENAKKKEALGLQLNMRILGLYLM